MMVKKEKLSAAFERDTTLNIFQRVHEVMKDVSHLQTDMTVSYGQSSYKALSESKVTSTLRLSMIKHGIAVYPMRYDQSLEIIRGEKSYNGQVTKTVTYLTNLDSVYRFVNTDDPKDVIDVPSHAHGVDSQDKGPGKASTYAIKYALLRLFMIPSGDDPDQIHSDKHVADQGHVTDSLDNEIASFVKKSESIEKMDVLQFAYQTLSELAKKSTKVQEAKNKSKSKIEIQNGH